MNTQTTPVQVETAYGTLYIAVAAADRHSYRDMERGDVVDLRPEVWISATPEFTAKPGTERHWTIRGRAYGICYHMILENRPSGRWHKQHTPYEGGLRNDRGMPVDFGTKTYDLVWDAMITALDDFAARYPGWEDASRYLLFSQDAEAAASRAEDARREAAKHDADADAARREAKGYASKLSVDAINLLK